MVKHNLQILPYSDLLALLELAHKMTDHYLYLGETNLSNYYRELSTRIFAEVDMRRREGYQTKGLPETNLSVAQFLNTPLEKVGLSPRAYNPLKAMDCKTVRDVLKRQYKRDLMDLRNFGPSSMEEVWSRLVSYLAELE